MDLLEKERIKEPLIMSNPQFDEHEDFVKGYFTNLNTVKSNEEFLEVYRYIQYWRLPYPDYMIYYANKPNYAKKSLLANMALTNDSDKDRETENMRYFKFFQNLIDNAFYVPSQLTIFQTSNNVYHDLVKIDRGDLVIEQNSKGNPFSDVFSETEHGNSTLEVVKNMLFEDYSPSDEVIIWYIQKGFGCIANMCIPSSTDHEFIYEEIPRDLDFYKELLDKKYDGYISEDDAEDILNHVLTDFESSKMKVDVALFLELYKVCSSKMSSEYKKVLLSIVSKREEPFLTYVLLRELFNEDCPCKLSPLVIRNLITDVIKDKRTYIIFMTEILNMTNYSLIVDVGNDISPEEIIPYEINSDDCADLIRERYCDESTSSDDYDDVDSCDDSLNDEYNYKYKDWDEFEMDDNFECDL